MAQRRKAKAEQSAAWQVEAASFAEFPAAVLRIDRDGTIAAVNAVGAVFLMASTEPFRTALSAAAVPMIARGEASVVSRAPAIGCEVLLVPVAQESGVLAILRDGDLERNLREALIESRERYKDLVEISSDFAWETDAEGRFAFVSPQGVLGWPPQALLGRPSGEFLVEPEDENAFAAARPIADGELWFRRKDGGRARLAIVAAPLSDESGARRGARGIGRDLTAARERDDALAHAQLRDRLFSHLVRAMRDELEPEAALAAAVAATGLALGAAGGVILRSGSGTSLTEAARWGVGCTAPALDAARAALGTSDGVILSSEGWQMLGHAARYRQKVEGAILLWRAAADGGFPDADRALLADVADQLGVAIAQVAQHEQMLALSRTDPLTGLMNRRAFFEELDRRLHRNARTPRPAALLFIDMDNFKVVNDVKGHRAGDEAILALAEILRGASRAGDLVARLGGDEFALWIDGLGRDGASARAETLLRNAVTLAQYSGDLARPLGISIGLALVEPSPSETPAEIVARADAAMYRAKSAGKGGIAIAEPAEKPAP
jgi:diguanylate cyclase (GGDEF)-like protein/PAS domain S-box-containing protein